MKATARNWRTVDEAARDGGRMMRSYTVLDVFAAARSRATTSRSSTTAPASAPRLMQRTARELNLSETVFMLPREADADARLRIFTPAAELPFAGHPVLGTAFVVGERSDATGGPARDRRGRGARRAEARARARHYAQMDQRIPPLEPFAVRARAARGARRWSAPSCRSRPTATARCTSTSRSRASGPGRRAAPELRALEDAR